MKEKVIDFVVEDGIQSLLAVSIIGTAIAMSLQGVLVPELIDTLAKIIVPFYFGSKIGGLAVRANMNRKE